MNEKRRTLIDKLAENEEAISQLYTAYANKFSNLKDFWSDLADDEVQHANWLRKLALKAEDEPRLYIGEGRFNVIAIQTYLQYLQRELTKAREGKLSLIEALAVALYIEKSLIESKFFEVFETDSVQLKHVLQGLAKATKAHHDKVNEKLIQHKQSLHS